MNLPESAGQVRSQTILVEGLTNPEFLERADVRRFTEAASPRKISLVTSAATKDQNGSSRREEADPGIF